LKDGAVSKISTKRLRELAIRGAVATPDEVRALVLEVKGARALIERFDATLFTLRHPQAAVCPSGIEGGTSIASSGLSHAAVVLN
jgi:hypothetical protein